MLIKTMPFHWFFIGICFSGINFINCMEDAVDPNRRIGKINCNLGHFCVADSGEISFKLEEKQKKYFRQN